jgi:hypothetical protein
MRDMGILAGAVALQALSLQEMPEEEHGLARMMHIITTLRLFVTVLYLSRTGKPCSWLLYEEKNRIVGACNIASTMPPLANVQRAQKPH